MADSSVLESELPPPPYSRHDPNAQAGVLGLADQPALHSLALPPEEDDPSTHVADGFAPTNAAPAVTHQSAASQYLQEAEPSFTSAQSYFESRQPGLQLRSDVLPHFISIPQQASPSDFPFPTPQRIWVERDVTLEDWTTFLNYLFPHHLARENARILSQKLHPAHRSNSPDDAELIRDHMQRGQENFEAFQGQALEASSESDSARRRRLQAVIREWNDGFFLPRALRIDPYIESPQHTLSNSINSPLAQAQAQASTPAPPFVYHVTHHDSSSNSSFRPSHGWEQYGDALKQYTDRRYDSNQGEHRSERGNHPDARYAIDDQRFDSLYRTPRSHLAHHQRGNHHAGHRNSHGHHRRMSDSSVHGQRGAPWMRPYRESGTSRRGCGRHRREHSFSGSEGFSRQTSDNPSGRDAGHLSPSRNSDSPRGHVRSASTSDAADIIRTKTALQQFFTSTMNDVSKLHENLEVLKNEIYSERRGKTEGLKNEWKETLANWTHNRRASRSTQSSVSEGITDGPLSPRSTVSSQSTRTSTDFDTNDLAKAMKQSFKTFKNEMKQKQKANKIERDGDKAALKEAEKQRKVAEKSSRKDCTTLKKKSHANLNAEVSEPFASPAVQSTAASTPVLASTAVSSAAEAHHSRESLPAYSDRAGGWSGSSNSAQATNFTNESDEQGVERGTI